MGILFKKKKSKENNKEEETKDTKKCLRCLRRISFNRDICPHCMGTEFLNDN